MFTQTEREWHQVYEELHPDNREVIDNAVGHTVALFRDAGYTAATDDTAEQLVAAVTKFFCESGNKRG